jgi:hypothetical protein
MLMYLHDTNNKGTQLDGAHIVTVKSGTKIKDPIAPAIPSTIEVFDPCGWDMDPENPANIDPATGKRKEGFEVAGFGCYQTTKEMGVIPYMVNQFRPYKVGKINGQQPKNDKTLYDITYPTIFC